MTQATSHKKEKVKDLSIETLRGVAILLVVSGYVITDDMRGGGDSIIASGLRFLYYCLRPIRMPLFTVISSYLYASSPATQATFKKLVTGKARRILIPFAVVSAMQYAFFSLVSDKGKYPLHEIYRVFLWPMDQFWFLYSIFWIFILVGILDAYKQLDTPRKWFGWLCLAIVMCKTLEPTRLFSIFGVNFLMPFFILGYGMRRFSKELFNRRMIFFYFAATLLAYALYVYYYIRPVPGGTPEPLYSIITMTISCTTVPLIFYFRRAVPLLAKIGYYAFGIHIFNKISSALPRMVFEHFHISGDGLLFVTYMVCAVVISIGLQAMMEKFSFTRKYVLGLKDPSPRHAHLSAESSA